MKAAQLIDQLKSRVVTLNEAIETFERLQQARSWRLDLPIGSPSEIAAPSRRGRPPGSKNKPKNFNLLPVLPSHNPVPAVAADNPSLAADLSRHEQHIFEHILFNYRPQTSTSDEV